MRSCCAVGDGDAQHRRVALDVEPVLQAQRPELVLAQFPGQVAGELVAVLLDPLVDECAVDGVVTVHGAWFYGASAVPLVVDPELYPFGNGFRTIGFAVA
jgi:hypothetical protein